MCLQVDQTKTTQRALEFASKGTETITVYKLFTIKYVGFHLRRKIMKSIFQNSTYNVGWHRASNKPSKSDKITKGAIHAYTDMVAVRRNALFGDVVIPCTANVEDIIAYGTDGDVCMTRIYISPENYQQAAQSD